MCAAAGHYSRDVKM